MKRGVTRAGVLLLACMLLSCGGGSGGDSTGGDGSPGTANAPAAPTPPTPADPVPPAPAPQPVPAPAPVPPTTGGDSTLPSAGARVEESDAAVILSGVWTPSTSRGGWSGGTAMESTALGATASFSFTGTSVRWIGRRNTSGGIARVSVDGRDATEVDLYSESNEVRTSVITLYDLGEGPHTLTIEVTGTRNAKAASNIVTVDAFEVEPQIRSRFQEMDPDVSLTAGWIQDPSSTWSGGGVASGNDPRMGGMRYTETAGEKATVKFRGTSIAWSGYRGPDGGIAIVRLDGGEPKEVDTYHRSFKAQEVVFTATGLADTNHTLTIEMTDRRNSQAIATAPVRIVVDFFEVTTPGRRYQQDDPAIAYSGRWTRDNNNRPWSEGRTATSDIAGSRATFTFTGTSVSWIGCQKESIGPANVYIDGAFVTRVKGFLPVPIEGYQRTVFRRDGLTPGQHTLTIEALGNGYALVDAFDVRP